MRWLNSFLKEFEIGAKERTAIELRCLIRAIHIGGVYDQLNSPSLASVEELSRRVCQLIEAYASGDANKPNWASVKHFTATSSLTSVVPSSLRTYALGKAKDEVIKDSLRARLGGSTALVGNGADGLLPAFPRRPEKTKAEKAKEAEKEKSKKQERQLAGAKEP